ncbi:probable carboxylesterase 12 [Oryza brachyantha]|uniref:probable carboxylesterase 12 n=1 Tax=Oryza brachyantha TaxID=4533 RepID=UPI001ADA3B29|nr:probable carboxylesterase 12 [Oryza brachyantha]
MARTSSSPSPAIGGAAAGGRSIAVDLYPFLRVYEGGHIERLVRSTAAVAASHDGAVGVGGRPARDGVATRDVVIDEGTGASARLFLPGGAGAAGGGAGRRLPLVLYFHGGAFVTGSAFGRLFHRYAASLAVRAGALVVSVEYRLAPEHPLPAAFVDGWAALRWATSLADPWLARYADLTRVFLAGESAGATIAHNVAVRAAGPDGDDVDIEGMALLQPCFWGAQWLPSEEAASKRAEPPMLAPDRLDALWPYVTAGAAGNDDPRIDPPAEDVSSLPCRRALVAVAEKDALRERGRRYAAQLRGGGGSREVTLVESEGEDHCFHLYRPARASAVELMDSVAEFISPTSCLQTEELPLRHRRRALRHAAGDGNTVASPPCAPRRDQLVLSGGPAKLGRPKAKVGGGPTCKAQRYRLVGMGRPMPGGTYKYSISAAGLRVLC